MVGTVTSEGDRAIRADVARQMFGLDGSGIQIGLIADSFNAQLGAANDVANGELPGEGNPEGNTIPVNVVRDTTRFSGFDIGRGLLHVIHDVAPGAELLFHTFEGDVRDFTNADVTADSVITALNALEAAGADIILDFSDFLPSTIFQDGAVAQAIDAYTQRGGIFVSPAGNSGALSYESPFRAGETFTFRGIEYTAHDFDPGEGIDLFQDIQLTDESDVNLLMNWQQASGAVESNFELFLVDRPQLPGAGGEVLSQSRLPIDAFTDAFDSTNDPAQGIEYASFIEQTAYLVIAKQQGSAELPEPGLVKWISVGGGGNDIVYQYVNDPATPGSAGTVFGQSNAAGAITVGSANFRRTPEFGDDSIEVQNFSSSGAAPILFDAQGNLLAVPEIRQKPDVIGPTNVSTPGTFFFPRIPATIGAAAHVTGLIALMLQRAGGPGSLTADQVRDILRETDLPVVPRPNLPADSGFVQADAAVMQTARFQQMGTAGNDELQGQIAADNLYGLEGDDTLAGGAGFDALFGGRGADTLQGGRDGDALIGQAGRDLLRGGQGDDLLMGNSGGDRLNGGKGSDTLLGEQGRDELVGGAGDDVLSGGTGRNILKGGDGSDVFVLDNPGRATIRDFEDGVDRLAIAPDLEFTDLTILQSDSDTLIQSADTTLARLIGIQADLITVEDTVAIADVLAI
ncbi:MAG: hypothetical protein VKK04_00105 [Synechococcales bacterium]|nr:hypothetical protein [Synechococcales bacterium]